MSIILEEIQQENPQLRYEKKQNKFFEYINDLELLESEKKKVNFRLKELKIKIDKLNLRDVKSYNSRKLLKLKVQELQKKRRELNYKISDIKSALKRTRLEKKSAFNSFRDESKLRKTFERSGFTNEKNQALIDILATLEMTTSENIIKALKDINKMDSKQEFITDSNVIANVISELSMLEKSKPLSFRNLEELIQPLDESMIAAITVHISQSVFRGKVERWEEEAGNSTRETVKNLIDNLNVQSKLKKLVSKLSYHAEYENPKHKITLAFVNGSTTSTVANRSEFALGEVPNFSDKAPFAMLGGDRKIFKEDGSPRHPKNSDELYPGFLDKVKKHYLDKKFSDVTEADAFNFYFEEFQNENQQPFERVTPFFVDASKDISENKRRTDTFGTVGQLMRDLKINGKDDPRLKYIVSYSNGIYRKCQALSDERAIVDYLNSLSPKEKVTREDVTIHPAGPAAKLDKITLPILSDVLAPTTGELMRKVYPELEPILPILFCNSRENQLIELQKSQIKEIRMKLNPEMKNAFAHVQNINSCESRLGFPKPSQITSCVGVNSPRA